MQPLLTRAIHVAHFKCECQVLLIFSDFSGAFCCREQKQKLSYILLESSSCNQVLIHCFICGFDDGPHEVQGTPAALFAAAQHAGILYAHSLKGKNRNEKVWQLGVLQKYQHIPV